MEVEELVNISPIKIRSDETLMRLYIQFYKDAFLVAPDCAGCTFTRDFNKLKNKINGTGVNVYIKSQTMKNYVLNPKYKNNIHTYVKNNRPYRTYGHLMTDEFAESYLKEGTKEQIKEREKLFDKLPSTEASKEKKVQETKADAPKTASKTKVKPEGQALQRKKRGAKKKS